jgi:hypothetical protein
MKNFQNELSSLDYSKIVGLEYAPEKRQIVLKGIGERENNEFILVFSGISSFLSIAEMPEQSHLENLATEIGMYSDEQAAKRAAKINALAIKGLTTKFYIATILYTLYFDSKIITLNGEVIFQTN